MPSVKARAVLYDRPRDLPSSALPLASSSPSPSPSPSSSSTTTSNLAVRRKAPPKSPLSPSSSTTPSPPPGPKPSSAAGWTEDEAPPPPLPIKPYPPRINDAIPPSPFSVNFPRDDAAGPSSEAETGNGLLSTRDPGTLMDATRSKKTNVRRSSKIPVPRPTSTSKSNDEALSDTTSRDGDEHDDGRDSVYSNASWASSRHRSVGLSAIVTTASAMSIKRAIASPRPMPSLAYPSASSSSSSSSSSSAAAAATAAVAPTANSRGRGPRVEKGTGVQARRKSRDKSSTRSSTTSSVIYPTVVLEDRKKSGSDAPPSASRRISGVASPPPPLPPSTSASSRLMLAEKKSREQQATQAKDSSYDSMLTPSSAISSGPSSSVITTPPAEQLLTPPNATASSSGLLTAHTEERRPSLQHRRGKGSFASSIALLDPLSDRWGSMSSQGYEKDNAALTSLDEAFATAAAKYGHANLPTLVSPTSPAMASSPRLPASISDHIKSPSSSTFDIAGSSGKRSLSTSNEHRYDSAGAAPTKELLLTQLLASLAHVDAQAYEPLRSIEEVEQCKAEVKRLEKKIVDLTHKLKVEMRVRDAADKVRRALSSSSGSKAAKSTFHARSASSASSTSVATNAPVSATNAPATFEELQKAEMDVVQARRKVDEVSKVLLEHKDQANVARRRLLQHEAKVLALRVTSLEGQVVDMGRMLSEQSNRDEETEEEEAASSSGTGGGDGVRSTKKVGHNLAVEEVEALRLKVERAEESLAHERREREKEVESWRKKHDENLEKQRLESSDKLKKERQEGERKRQRVVDEANREKRELEKQKAEADAQIKEAKVKVEEAGVSLATERAVMRDHRQLLEAFERKLEKTESKLRHEDERCAKMLGKTEGREEMDDLLAQIKAGYGNAPKKGEKKTAGKDIDSLLDSLATHISDMADEMAKAGGVFKQRRRKMRQEEGHFYDEDEESMVGAEESEEDNDQSSRVREMELELRSTERELEKWRSEAESAKRQLTVVQRNSAISATGSSIMGGGVGSQAGRSFDGHLGSRDWRASRGIASNATATAELEARITLLEKRNASLEEELTQAKLMPSPSSSSSSPVKVPGAQPSKGDDASARQQLATAKMTLSSLIEALPEIPRALVAATTTDDSFDLDSLQKALDQRTATTNVAKLASRFGAQAKPSVESAIDAKYGGQVVERARGVLTAARLAVKRAMALQQMRASLEREADEAQERCEDLNRAMEDLRNGQADQTQLVEAAKAREKKLESTVSELKAKMEKLKKAAAAGSHSATTESIHPNPSPMLTPAQSNHSISSSVINQGLLMAPNKALAPSPSKRQMGTVATPVMSRSPVFSLAQTYKSSSAPFTEQYAMSKGKISQSSSTGSTISPLASASASLYGPSPHRRAKDLPSLPSTEEQLMDSPSAQLRRLQLESEAALNPSPSVPRTITLGMDTRQLIERVRALETKLVDVSKRSSPSNDAARINRMLQDRLDESRAEMERMHLEFEEIKEVDARQRVQLLEELSTLTSELSTARADLRAAQRKAG